MKEVQVVQESPHGPGPELNEEWPSWFPTAVTLITCISPEGKPNILPVCSATAVNRYPFMIGVSVCRARYSKDYVRRYSHYLITETREFVVNVPHSGMREAISICGETSGRDTDKFQAAGFTMGKSLWVAPPIIDECPVNLECVVHTTVTLGSHDLFIGRVVVVHKDKEAIFTSNPGAESEGRQKKVFLWSAVPVREEEAKWCERT